MEGVAGRTGMMPLPSGVRSAGGMNGTAAVPLSLAKASGGGEGRRPAPMCTTGCCCGWGCCCCGCCGCCGCSSSWIWGACGGWYWYWCWLGSPATWPLPVGGGLVMAVAIMVMAVTAAAARGALPWWWYWSSPSCCTASSASCSSMAADAASRRSIAVRFADGGVVLRACVRVGSSALWWCVGVGEGHGLGRRAWMGSRGRVDPIVQFNGGRRCPAAAHSPSGRAHCGDRGGRPQQLRVGWDRSCFGGGLINESHGLKGPGVACPISVVGDLVGLRPMPDAHFSAWRLDRCASQPHLTCHPPPKPSVQRGGGAGLGVGRRSERAKQRGRRPRETGSIDGGLESRMMRALEERTPWALGERLQKVPK